MMVTLISLATVATMILGLGFLFIGALGLWRLPDLYNRMHAASKCMTLGVSGLLLATVIHLSSSHLRPQPLEEAPAAAEEEVAYAGTTPMAAVVTKGILLILFQFVAAPVGAHLLARAAYLDGVKMCEGTISDELAEDAPGQDAPPRDAPGQDAPQ